MAKGFWLKAGPNINFKTVTGFFVKVSPSTWQTVNDAWVKVKQTGADAFRTFWQSATNPDSPIEILTSFTATSELLRLQGKNYHWTPTPSTLFYTFTHVDNLTATTYTLTSSTSTSNPISGSSITVPTSTTYRTISKDPSNNEFAVGGLSTYKFTVTGTTSGGAVSVQTAEYSMRTPNAPILSVERLSGTSVKLTITAASSDDYVATNRYIVSTYDTTAGGIESGGGRGGYAADVDPVEVTLTGMTAGRLYIIYVTPFTGSAGTTEANATGYTGLTANINTTGEADYNFAFGNVLHIGTNGYIGLDSASSSDSIASTTGRVIGIFPKDLYQSTTTSLWYWSDTNKFIIIWEGYDYSAPSNLKQYEIVFTKDQSYATVYAINVTSAAGTSAWVKEGVTKTSYATALETGSWRQIYFDGVTNPTSLFGPYVPKSKTVMKQVTGLTAGTQDQGYTSITTSTNQNTVPALGAFDVASFTKGTVSSSSQGATRTTALSWGQSTNATRYEIQYEGRYYSTDPWVSLQDYAYSGYINEPTRSQSKQFSSQNSSAATDSFPGYSTFIRANIRASESTGTSAFVYSNSGTYIEASGTAPGQVTFGTISKTGTTASIAVATGTQGSNYLYADIEYKYRTDSGTYPASWSSYTPGVDTSIIPLTGLAAGIKYWIKVRNRNYDELYSTENETNFTTLTTPSAFTTISFTKAKASESTRSLSLSWNASTNGPNYEIQYEGSSNGSTWTILQSFNVSPYTTLTSNTYSAAEYKFYRAAVRARNSNKDFDTAAYSDGGTSSSYVYINAAGENPDKPTIGVITVTTTTASAAFTHPTNTGSSTIDWIQFSLNQTDWYNDFSSPFQNNPPMGGLSADTNYTLYARSLNYDGLYSATPDTSKGFRTNALTLYKITFDSKTGSAVAELTQTTEGGSIAQPTNPTLTNYIFGGWSATDGGTAVSWPYTPTANITLYAKWTYRNLISFDVNGGSGSAPTSLRQATAGGSLALPGIGSMTGPDGKPDFGGWATSSTATTTVSSPYTPTADTTLYAKWSAAAVVAPGTPSSATWGTHTYAYVDGSLSTTLTNAASGNSTKTQNWTYQARVTFNLSFGTGTNAASYEVYSSAASTAPTSETTGTNVGNTTSHSFTAVQTGRGTLNRYAWVRSVNSAGNSSWRAAGLTTSTATVVSGLATAGNVKICRTGTTTCTNAPTTGMNALLTHQYLSVNTGFSHKAYISNANIAGTSGLNANS